MSWNRRRFLASLCRTTLVLPFSDVLAMAIPPWKQSNESTQHSPAAERSYNSVPRQPAPAPASPIASTPLGVQFIDVARKSGLNAETIYGGRKTNEYLLETTGCGVAFYDYDNDGWPDIFLVNGWRLEGFPDDKIPRSHLFKNNRDGTFTDVTDKAGVGKSGWGQACCVGDYDNDGNDDLFVSYYGQNSLFHNNGDGTFSDVTKKALLTQSTLRWNAGCAFLDYDRDGYLDLFVANYIDLDLKTAPRPESGPCTYKGIMVACGPPGLAPGRNILYHNNGDGTFTDVSEKSGIWKTTGSYSLGVAVADLDNDGWPDIYVADDSTASILYQNQKNGTFKDVAIEDGVALSPDGSPQAGMGVAIGDYNHDGNLDILKTNFAGDTDSLYANLGDGNYEDRTYPSGLGTNTRFLGWGVGFFDMDNDGWLDILITNGHVYPEVNSSKTEAHYAEQKYLYRNLHNGRFQDVTQQGGPGIAAPVPGRGCAFGDYDNDGNIDIVVNCVNAYPQLLRCTSEWKRNWIKIKTVGVRSNRTGIGARIRIEAKPSPNAALPLVQVDEVRSGGSYFSQNELRLHFGLDQAKVVDLIEIHWPSGLIDRHKNIAVNKSYIAVEGAKVLKEQRL
ncbi:MAG: CRTAC1 family protein [Acidobacteriaceae bacterium]